MSMRRKVGTIVDEELLKRAKVRAAQEGKAFSELLGTALETYLSRRAGASGERLVDEGWGAFRITRRELRQALKGDLLET